MLERPMDLFYQKDMFLIWFDDIFLGMSIEIYEWGLNLSVLSLNYKDFNYFEHVYDQSKVELT